jgi:hypothetical protein
MDDEQLSPDQERELLDLFEQAALHDFPNPDRVGCPGSEFLRKLASNRKSISVRDPRLTHVARCSPCFQEFAAFRNALVKRRRRRRLLGTAASALVVVAVVAGFLSKTRLFPFIGSSRIVASNRYIAARLDLQSLNATRGVGEPAPPSSKAPLLELAARKLDLTITLPFASDAGEYQVQIQRENGTPLASASGSARIQADGATLLNVKLDLSGVLPGTYQLGVRRTSWDWAVHPILIR